MDEKIFSRIIPVVIAIVVLIVQYVIKNQKKKNLAEATVPLPKSNEAKPNHIKEIVKTKEAEKDHRNEVENLNRLITNTHNITNDSKSNNKKTAFTTMKKNIKPSVNKTIEIVDNEKSSFTFSGDELKKAIIYSEIFNPKHF